MLIIPAIFVFLLGAAIGSFLNCLAWRLYHQESLWGRSHCPKCQAKIHWYDNVPLFSFFILGGKCRHCRQAIAHQYWLVELATAALFLLAFSRIFFVNGVDLLSTFNFITFNSQLLWLLRDWVLISFLIIIFITDLRWYVILDEISLPAIAIILAFNLFLGISWWNLGLSAIIGAGFFGAQYLISRGRWIGGGDIRLGALMGVALGWPQVVVALMLAYFAGAAVGLGLIASGKKQMKSAVPFGIFLAPTTLVALWWGQAIMDWYLKLLF